MKRVKITSYFGTKVPKVDLAETTTAPPGCTFCSRYILNLLKLY